MAAAAQWRLAVWLLLNLTLRKAQLKIRLHWAKSQHVGPRPKYPWVPLKGHVMLGKSPNLSGLVFSSLKWV